MNCHCSGNFSTFPWWQSRQLWKSWRLIRIYFSFCFVYTGANFICTFYHVLGTDMASRKHFKPILITVYWIGCLTGLIFQAKEVCKQYFGYKTSTWVEITIPEEIPIRSLTFCIAYVNILNRTDYYKYGLSQHAAVLSAAIQCLVDSLSFNQQTKTMNPITTVATLAFIVAFPFGRHCSK